MVKKVSKELEVKHTSKGSKQQIKNIKDVTKATKISTKAGEVHTVTQNKIKRAQEGVARTSLASSKQFSKQAQGLGGLVRAYATVAASVFALSAVFNILKDAADFQSMINSSENLAQRTGSNLLDVARAAQAATGHNVSLAQSLESVNKASSAGADPKQTEQIARLAALASQTFGGSIEANINRFTSALLRGRTELLATIGVVIDLEQAYENYANIIGKTATELTVLEKKQATINATVEEGSKIFENVDLDRNPYVALFTTLKDVSTEFLLFVNKFATGFLEIINESKKFAGVLIATIGAIFLKKLTPDAEIYAAKAQQAIGRVVGATVRANFAMNKLAQQRNSFQNTQLQKRLRADAKFTIEWAKLQQLRLEEAGKINKSITILANASIDEILANTGKAKQAITSLRGESTKKQNNPGRNSSAFPNVRDAQKFGANADFSRQKSGLDTTGREVVEKQDRSFKNLFLTMRGGSATFVKFRANTAKLSARQRLLTVTLVEQRGVIAGLGAAYGKIKTKFIAFDSLLKRQGKTASVSTRIFKGMIATNLALATSFQAVGIVINRILPILGLITLAFTFAKEAFDKFSGKGDREAAIEKINESFMEFQNVLGGVSETVFNFNKLLETTESQGIRGFGKQLTFVTNATQALQSAFDAFSDKVESFENPKTIEQFEKAGKQLEDQIEKLEKRAGFFSAVWNVLTTDVAKFFNEGPLSTIKSIFLDSNNAEAKIESLQEGLDELRSQEDIVIFVNMQVQEGSSALKRFKALIDKNVASDLFTSGLGFKSSAENLLKNLAGAIATEAPNSTLVPVINNVLKEIGNGVAPDEAVLTFFRGFAGLLDMYPTALNAAAASNENWTETMMQSVTSVKLATQSLESLALSSAELENKLSIDLISKTDRPALTNAIKNTINALKTLQAENAKTAGTGEQAWDAFISGTDTGTKRLIKILGLTEEGVKDVDGTLEQLTNRYDLMIKAAADKVVVKFNLDQLKSAKALLEIEGKRSVTTGQIGMIAEQLALNEIKTLNQRIILAQNAEDIALDTLTTNIRGLDADVRANKAKHEAAKADREALEAQRDAISESEAGIRARLAVNLKSLNVSLAILNNARGVTKIEKNLTIHAQHRNKFVVQEFALQQRALENRKAALRLTISETEELIRQKTFGRIDVEKLLNAKSQLLVLQAQTQELARQKILGEAEAAAQGQSVFSPTQADAFLGQLFTLFDDFSKAVPSIGARVAIELNSAGDKIIDASVDKLIEGGVDMAEVIKETLRESVGNVAKSVIKESIKGILSPALASMMGLQSPTVTKIQTTNDILNEILTLMKGTPGTTPGAGGVGVGTVLKNSAKSAGSSAISGIIGGLFANGGMTEGGINRYGSGTITTGPELAVIGEGKRREAIVPLPNNREIPVQLSGDSSSQPVTVNQSIAFNNADPSTEARIRRDMDTMRDQTVSLVRKELNRGGTFAKQTGRR